MRIVTQGQRTDAATAFARQAGIKNGGFAVIRHELLKDDRRSGAETCQIRAQIRCVIQAAHAIAVPADIGLGDDREFQAASRMSASAFAVSASADAPSRPRAITT